MEHAANLILVDSDTRRRASICHALSASSIHVEPFETVAELTRSWPRSGTILIYDAPGAVPSLVTQMTQCGEWFPVIAFSETPTPAQIVQAILDGAIDYIGWPLDAKGVNETLQRTERRTRGVASARIRESMARRSLEKLTRREREVLDGVANGLSNRLIAQRLAISPRTVEIHRANMLNKLGANHTSEAIRIAIEAELAS